MALANAIAAGFYLHYARTTIKSDTEYGKWLRENFTGTTDRAEAYVKIARAWVVSPPVITGCGGIQKAVQKARTITIPEDLPANLNDYGKTPKQLEEEREAKEAKEKAAKERRRAGEEREEKYLKERRERREEREREEKEPPPPPEREPEEPEDPNPLARKAEAILRKAISTESVEEAHAFFVKAHAIIREHNFHVDLEVSS
jgi:hypothetical protein